MQEVTGFCIILTERIWFKMDQRSLKTGTVYKCMIMQYIYFMLLFWTACQSVKPNIFFFLTDTVFSEIYFSETIPKHSALHNINKDSWLVDVTQNIVHLQTLWILILCKKVFNCLELYMIICSLDILLGCFDRQTQSVSIETRLKFPAVLHFYCSSRVAPNN